MVGQANEFGELFAFRAHRGLLGVRDLLRLFFIATDLELVLAKQGGKKKEKIRKCKSV
jgi:hypothetical protein